MLGLMQDWPLLVHKIIDHAALYHGDREVVSRSVEGPIVRTNYREIARRSRKMAHALDRLLVETVQATYPAHEQEQFLAHFRGLLGMWVSDQAVSLS